MPDLNQNEYVQKAIQGEHLKWYSFEQVYSFEQFQREHKLPIAYIYIYIYIDLLKCPTYTISNSKIMEYVQRNSVLIKILSLFGGG